MRTVVVRQTGGPEVLRIEEIPRPAVGPRDVLIRVVACGVCTLDVVTRNGTYRNRVQLPLTPGHEIAGTVEEVGDEVRRFRPGERVATTQRYHICGSCRFCRGGAENLCERSRYTGYHADGGYAEYALARADFAYAIPDQFDDARAAPLLCAGIIGYRALRLSRVIPGQRLLMYGFGSSAHVTMQVALARGVEVFVCTREPAHRALARTLGAAWTGALTDRPPAPAHGAIVFAPAGELVPIALANLAPGGTLALAGIYMTAIPRLDYADLHRERTVTTVTANTRDDGRELLAEAGRIGVRPTVTTFPLEQANVALQALKAGAFAGSGVLLTAAGAGV